MDTAAIAFGGWGLTLVVAAAGWIASAVIGARGRRDTLRLEVVEHARRELAPNVSAYQKWIGELYTELMMLGHLRLVEGNPGFTAEYVCASWKAHRDSLQSVLKSHDQALAMFRTLEDYEVVFPQTRGVRIELIQFHQRLVAFATGALSLVTLNSPYNVGDLGGHRDLSWLDAVDGSLAAFSDMQALCEDIRIGVQNDSLSRVMGAEVPRRQPFDPDLPMVVTTGTSWHVQNELPELPPLGEAGASG